MFKGNTTARLVLAVTAALALGVSVTSARGDLMRVGPVDVTTGTGQDLFSGNVTIQGQSRPIAQLMTQGIDTAAELGVILRPVESNVTSSATLTQLSLSIQNPGGATVFTADTPGLPLAIGPVVRQVQTVLPLPIESETPEADQTVVDRAGTLFVLTPQQSQAAEPFFVPENSIGLTASLQDVQGGPGSVFPVQAFLVEVNRPGEEPGGGIGVPIPIPEPSTAAMLALAGLALLIRRKR